MTPNLKLSPDLSLPLDAVTETFGIIGQRGAGKTVLAKVLAEELATHLLPVCVLDPLGVWWGVRSSATGKGPGKEFVILGGDHADVPLEERGGDVVADFVVDQPGWTVIDLSHFRKAEMRRFVAAFLGRVYHRNRDPLHLIVDEADLFAPQFKAKDETALLGAMEDIVRRGRARGLGVTMVSQRPAVLHKDVLSQVSTLVAMRTVGLQDRNALDAWTQGHGTAEETKQLKAALPSLPTGTAWFWSPSWLGVFKQVKIRAPETFDSSATPKGGQRPAEPRVKADVDLAELKERLAATIEKAKAEDPKELRRLIAERDREIGRLHKQLSEQPQPEPVTVEVPVVTDDHVAQLTALWERVGHEQAELEDLLGSFIGDVEAIGREQASRAPRRPSAPQKSQRAVPSFPASPSAAERSPKPAGPIHRDLGEGQVTGPERKILTALALYGACSKRKLALMAGYAVGGGGFNNPLGALRSRGLVSGKDTITITDEGVEALGSFDPLPTGAELLEYWKGKWGHAESQIISVLAAAYPATLAKEEVAAATVSTKGEPYEPTAGGFNNPLGKLRTAGVVEGSSDALTLAPAIGDQL